MELFLSILGILALCAAAIALVVILAPPLLSIVLMAVMLPFALIKSIFGAIQRNLGHN